MGARDVVLEIAGLRDPWRNGFIMAKWGVEDGTLHSVAAVGLILQDKDFIAECELRGKDKTAMAWSLVRKWQADMVKGKKDGVQD